MFLVKEGIKPLVIERASFPRYHIGESMNGECGGVLRALGLEAKMLEQKYPQKQGVAVYGPGAKNRWFLPVMARDENNRLVETFTWQVRRSDFDSMMHQEAQARGVEFLHAEVLEPLRADDAGVTGLRVRLPDGGIQDIQTRVVLDCSGQSTFLARQGVTSRRMPGFYDKQVAIFSQFRSTVRDNGKREEHPDNTLIFYKDKHHWAWFIPLDDEIVSVGIVSPGAYFSSKKESCANFLRREVRELNPELSQRIPDLELVEEARAIPNYSYHVETFTGKGWICIGDAHRFIDPIFSFGLFLTMKEAQFVAPFVREYLEGKYRDLDNPFEAHMQRCEAGMNLYQDLIDGFWEKPNSFAYLVHGERWRADLIDIFAGRVYMEKVSPGLEQLRMLAQVARGKMKIEPTIAV